MKTTIAILFALALTVVMSARSYGQEQTVLRVSAYCKTLEAILHITELPEEDGSYRAAWDIYAAAGVCVNLWPFGTVSTELEVVDTITDPDGVTFDVYTGMVPIEDAPVYFHVPADPVSSDPEA